MISPAWIAQLAVGQLRAADGFVHGAENTAESFVQCAITGNMYNPYDPIRSDRRSEPLTIDGHAGWLIETDITVDRPRSCHFPGDRTVFIVVADGRRLGPVLRGGADRRRGARHACWPRPYASLRAS